MKFVANAAPNAATPTTTNPIGLIKKANAAVNPETANINGNSVRLYSWSGTAPLTNVLDASDVLFGITRFAFTEANDGVTGKCSSHFGKVLKDDYFMNHLDVTNQLFGAVSLFETNPKTLFQNHASRLKSLSL